MLSIASSSSIDCRYFLYFLLLFLFPLAYFSYSLSLSISFLSSLPPFNIYDLEYIWSCPLSTTSILFFSNIGINLYLNFTTLGVLECSPEPYMSWCIVTTFHLASLFNFVTHSINFLCSSIFLLLVFNIINKVFPYL